jgi:hypothetical protein
VGPDQRKGKLDYFFLWVVQRNEKHVFARQQETGRQAPDLPGGSEMADGFDGCTRDRNVGVIHERTRGRERPLGIGFAQRSEGGRDKRRIARIRNDLNQRLCAAQAPQRSNGGKLHFALLVGQSEHHDIGGRLSPGLRQSVNRCAAHVGIVVRECPVEDGNVVVAQRLR